MPTSMLTLLLYHNMSSLIECGLNNYPFKAEGCGMHNIGNTTMKKWSKGIFRFSILFIMMFVCGASDGQWQDGKSKVSMSPTNIKIKSNEKDSISEHIVLKDDKDDEAITPFIIGGSVVTPREFKVRFEVSLWPKLLDHFFTLLHPARKFFAWLGGCGASLVAPNVVSFFWS